MEQILYILGTIWRLEKQFEEATDPRERYDLAETLDLLENSLKKIVDKYSTELGGENEKDTNDDAA